MLSSFFSQIEQALGSLVDGPVQVTETGEAELPSCFAVTDLAVASFRAAAVELASLKQARAVEVNRRLAALWFNMSLRPEGWTLPPTWDAIAGLYRCSDGWIRLHTNAPHHRAAALRVLKCAADKEAVKAAVIQWQKSELETAIVLENGAAAAMHSREEWAEHPQGKAVAEEPLIAWADVEECPAVVALEDLKVLDLTRVLAGPVATRFLAGFGAQVLRIDPPWWNEPNVEPEVTLGKRRAGLDLTQAQDRQTFEALLAKADVLVHGYRPDALSGLGYGPTVLRKIAPRLIDISLCAYGWHGPWAGRRGFDSLVQMSCGIAAEGMHRKGNDTPVPLPVQALDHATGYLMAAAALRAVHLRNTTGQIRSARLSLARTAMLLTSAGSKNFQGDELVEQPEDWLASLEQTVWGPAKRLRFPVRVDGVEPNWQHPAGLLRIDNPTW